ncbi:hypothetical protein BH10PSE17_BH10PSE17_05580 [soil metagenome]
MAYDYSSESKRLELPNPYRLQNLFLFASAAVLVIGGVVGLLWARDALSARGVAAGLAPLIVGVAMIASGLLAAGIAARRLRFFFGRGRPASLAKDIATGTVGNSPQADQYKEMLRQGGIAYPEPSGALNGVLYHLSPRLITAPAYVQSLAQREFFNALALIATFISFIVAYFVFGTDATRPWISAAYFVFGVLVLLRALLRGTQARMSLPALVTLFAAAIVGPVAIGALGERLPTLSFSLQVQTFALLGISMIAVFLVLIALFAQVGEPPPTERSCEQVALSMNGPPGALIDELDRKLQAEWVERIPNRRYTRLEPLTNNPNGSGQFAGELFEETQPMPVANTAAPTFAGAIENDRHRWLVVLDAFATVLVVAAVGFALFYVHQFDTARLAETLTPGHIPIGMSAICAIISAFCFRAAASMWGRFNFESVLVWVEMQGNWQSSRIGTGNQLTSRMNTESDVVRAESMTLRVWRARIETVLFGKDDRRQVVAMFATSAEARSLITHLGEFARGQSVFIAPGAAEDERRLAALRSGELKLEQPALAGRVPPPLAHAATASGLVSQYCDACGQALPAGARFCANCGKAQAAPAT